LETTTDAFDDVEFAVVARVVTLEDAPVGELPAALDETPRSLVRDPAGGAADTGKKIIE
jgi:hypothetical protein